MVTVKAHYRKSKGEYKPLIKYSTGRTEVVQQSPDRFDRHTKNGVIKGNRYARGTTYPTKEAAIDAAQSVIRLRMEKAQETLARGEKMGRDTSRSEAEVAMWKSGLSL